ncbi:armadillo repeat-containing protein 12-like isoform X2 [Hemicordylus capensis]|uniref:armadillo repeat-containing protein 12-like isoform X2 n=1 Tax=Hemicordylus capensis TaxID=884348 RepID=UPI00230450AE|nr:armadillo repeat-containing protein 12-like isoform X2 [Hemicordylus capensis]
MMKYLALVSPRNMATVATGAGAAFLLAKTIVAGIHSPPYTPEPITLAKLALEDQTQPVSDSGELRGLLKSLSPKLDNYSKNMILHGITRSVYLLDSEASACTYEDLKLVASFMDDPDVSIKIQALHALKAFTGIWKFKIKLQEFVPRILEVITNTWDSDVHVAGLRLLNGLQLPDHTHVLLKKLMPLLMDILQMGSTLAQVQVVKFLTMLAEKEDLLYDIMNCQVHQDFLNLFQPSRSGNLLFELLVFVERLCEGRLTPQYQSVHWQYNELSLHEVLFGEHSHLADNLLSLIIHPEEEMGGIVPDPSSRSPLGSGKALTSREKLPVVQILPGDCAF